MLTGTVNGFRFPHQKQVFVDSDRVLTTQDLNGVIVVDSTSGPVTLTLPSALQINSGGSFLILAETGDTNAVTVALGDPGDTYNEGLSANFILNTKNAQLLVLGQSGNAVWTYLPASATTSGGGGGSGASVLGLGNGSITAGPADRVLTPWYENAVAQLETDPTGAIILPRAGTLQNLFVRHASPGGNATNLTYTVRVNGIATALSVTMAANAASGSDTTNSVAVVQGDEVDVLVAFAGSIGSSPGIITAGIDFQ